MLKTQTDFSVFMKHILKGLKLILPLPLGGYLMWYFYDGLSVTELNEVKQSFVEAHYGWVALAVVFAFLSHLSRAHRWLLLVEPLGYRPRLSTSFYSVMAGYIINYTVPRAGEFARAGLLDKYAGVPFEKAFATIVVERIFDVLMLGIVALLASFMQLRSEEFNAIKSSAPSFVQSVEVYWPWLLLFGGIGLSVFVVLYRRHTRMNVFVKKRIRAMWEGLLSFVHMKRKLFFIVHTLFIWICYVGCVWIFAQSFTLTQNMAIGCIFGAFTVGAAAIAVTPGGLGTYPLWVNQVLLLYGISFKGFGVFMWVVMTSIILLLGLLSLFLIQRKRKNKGSRALNS